MFKECAMRLADGILAKEEDLLRQAITYKIGHDKWKLIDVEGRCDFLIDGNKKETFCIDKEPLVEFYPVKSSFEDSILKASQNYRVLYT
jgi:hypothetical protein